jgi:hypothetical protein
MEQLGMADETHHKKEGAMKRARTILTPVVLMILLGGAAYATDLFTPVVIVGPANTPGNAFRCLIVNVSSTAHDVIVEVKNALDGTNVSTFSGTLSAGTTNGAITQSDVGGAFYCHFSVAGSKANFRASGAMAPPATGDTLIVPAE